MLCASRLVEGAAEALLNRFLRAFRVYPCRFCKEAQLDFYFHLTSGD